MLLTEETKVLKRWREYFQELFTIERIDQEEITSEENNEPAKTHEGYNNDQHWKKYAEQ